MPILSKVLEKLILRRIKAVIKIKEIIPEHQFGFREQHGTTEQVHRIVRKINKTLEERKYCSVVLLDITQAFNKVWHLGLLYKIKKQLPHNFYHILKSYLTNRHFQIRYQDKLSELQRIKSGVPQGSVLGPLLYLLYITDLSTTQQVTTGTFADTIILATHKDPKIASKNLQENIDKLQE